MKTIHPYLYAMLQGALKSSGTYDPDQVLGRIEEQLTLADYRELHAFLGWVHRNDKQFGRDTYNERFAEWKESLK
jgi:hypothetical protein